MKPQAWIIAGAVAGWSLLRDRFGRKSWSEILDAGIAAADGGFPVTELTAAEWASAASSRSKRTTST